MPSFNGSLVTDITWKTKHTGIYCNVYSLALAQIIMVLWYKICLKHGYKIITSLELKTFYLEFVML
jgi:hypothetical protein